MSDDRDLYLLSSQPVPGETDLEACRRIFRGEKFPCRRCGDEIEWPGVCDVCDEALRQKESPPSINDLVARSGVPPALRQTSWDNFDDAGFPRGLKNTLQRVREWRPSTVSSILTLSGPPGVGKSHMAVATIRRYLKSGRRHCRFVSVPELITNLRATIAANAQDDLVHSLEGTGLLVLDDLGATRGTSWAVDVQCAIVGSRYNSERGTVITTNFDLDEIADKIDERIASRLAHGLVIRIDLPDYRVRSERAS